MARKKILFLALAIFAISGISVSILPAHSNVPPPWTVSLSANSRTPTDAQIFPSGSFGKTFFIGAIINASGSTAPAAPTCPKPPAAPNPTCLQNVFGWQFSIVYDNTSFVPQGDPVTGAANDAAGPTVNFGAQPGPTNPNWAGRITAGTAFGSSTILPVDATHQKIQVFYTLLAPPPPAVPVGVDIFPQLTSPLKSVQGNLLAQVAFEIKKAVPSPGASFSITDIKFVDPTAATFAGINGGPPITEIINNTPPTASFTATNLPSGDPSCAAVTGLACSAFAVRFDGSASSATAPNSIATPAGYFWDFGDGSQDNANIGVACILVTCNQGTIAVHDYGIGNKFDASLRVVDTPAGATGSARDSLGALIVNTQPSHTFRPVSTISAVDSPPTVSFTESTTTVPTGTPITLTITATDTDATPVASIKVVWGDGLIDTLPATATSDTHSYAVAGTFTVYVNATDTANLTTKSSTATKIITDRPPTVSFTESLSTAPTGTLIALTISASDPDGTISSVKVSWGDGTIDTLPGTATTDSHAYTSTGNAKSAAFTVYVNATDNSGSTTKSTTTTKTITDRAPTVSFTESTTTTTPGTSITLTISAVDPDGTVSAIRVVWGDGTIDNLGGAVTTDSHAYTVAGTFSVYVNATDNSGSTTKSSAATKTVATNKPPVVTFTETLTTVTTGQAIALTISATDPNTGASISSIKVVWGDGTIDTLPGTATSDSHSYVSTGSIPVASFTVYVNATDNLGLTGKSPTATKTISDRAPIVSFTESLTTANTGQSISLTITASDPDGTVASLKVSWGDGTVDTLGGTVTTDSHTYANTGNAKSQTFSVYVNATDNSGVTTKSAAATKTINDRPPTVSFTESATTVPTGTSITLTITSADPDGTVASLKVFWGDGTVDTLAGTATTDSHSYANTGGAKSATFNVYVNATDNSGSTTKSAVATKTITDRAPTVSFTEDKTTAQVNATINLTITSADPDGTVSSLVVVWGDGKIDTLAGTATSDGHAYTAQGSFTVYVNATDNSGSITKSSTSSKTISAQSPPTVSFTENTTSATTGQMITLTITASDPNTGGSITAIKVAWGDGTIDSLGGTATTDSHSYASTGATPTATFQVYVNATDNFGLTGKSSSAAKTISDKPPVVGFTESLSTANTGQTITLTIAASDPDGTISSLKVAWGDGTVDTLLGSATSDSHSYANTGNAKSATFNLYVNATDNSASTTKSATAIKTINDRPPTVSFTESATTVNIGQAITLTISAADADGTVSSLKVSWGDGTVDTLPGTATGDTHSYSTFGSFSVYINATDNSGSVTKSAVASKTVTQVLISVSFTENLTTGTTGQTITLTMTASEAGGTITSLKVVWGDGTIDSLAGTATTDSHAYPSTGSTPVATFTVYVNATDSAGRTQKSSSAIKTINDRRPTVSFTESATTANTGQAITLTITAADPDGTIANIVVFWGDGTIDTLPGAATTDSHSYASTGASKSATFNVFVNATDNSGSSTWTAVVVKTINDRPPTVSFIENLSTANIGQTITLTITAADPDGTIGSLKVSWGDGTVDTLAGTATTDSHPYASPGTFTVYVNATDNSGQTTQSAATTKTIQTPTINVSFTENTTSATTGQSITLTITAAETGGTIASLKVAWGDGTVDTLSGTATSDSHSYSTANTFTVYVNATDSSGHTAKSASATKTITVPTGATFSLTFQAFDVDDFENGVGQLDVWLNNNLVVNIPTGQTGSGDFGPFHNTLANLGPYDVTSFMRQGTNNLTFTDPLTSHETEIRNIKIVSGTQTILSFRGPRDVNTEDRVTILFSNPPLHISSFTATPNPVVEEHTVIFTASYDGGVGPFRCRFNFGDDSSATVFSTTQSCSVVHTYDQDGNFTATVTIRGANTNDKASSTLTINVLEQTSNNQTITPAVTGDAALAKSTALPDDD